MNSRALRRTSYLEQAFGQEQSLGTSRMLSRVDHTHGTPADPNDDILANVLGTTNQVTVTDNGDGTITLSLPSAIELTGATATRLLATDGDKLTSSEDLASWVAGTTGRVTVTDDGDGTITLTVPLKAGYGLDSDAGGLKLKQQAAESDASAVSAISAGAGGDSIDLSTFNTALGTLVTEINAIKTTLNNLLAKLRTAEVLAT